MYQISDEKNKYEQLEAWYEIRQMVNNKEQGSISHSQNTAAPASLPEAVSMNSNLALEFVLLQVQ